MLRLHRVGVEELWLDEAFSFRDASLPGWLWDLRLKDVPPLYPILLHTWMTIAGDGESALRLPSVLLGTLLVGAIMWAAWEIFDARVALWSGLVAALSPIGIYYSQEARSYALLTALVASTYALLWRALRGNTRRQWVAVAAATAAALYSHYLAPLALLPAAALLAASPERGRWPRYLGAMALAGIVFLPWVVLSFVLTTHPVSGAGWIREAWEHTPPLLAIPRSLEILHLGPERGLLPIALKQFDTLEYPAVLRALGLGGLALLGLWVGGPWAARGVPGPWPGRRAAALWVMMLFPLVVLWTISWSRPLYVAGRYDQLALPAFVLLVGLGLGRLQAVGRRGIVLAVLGALALTIPVGIKLGLYYDQPPRSRDRTRLIAAALDQRVADGGLVVMTGLREITVGYQLHRLGYRLGDGWCVRPAPRGRFGCRAFPRVVGRLPLQTDTDRVAGAPEVVRADMEEDLAALGTPPSSVWVVLGDYRIEAGRLAVPAADGLLLQELASRGFRPASVDAALGVIEYRSAGAAPTR